MVNRREVKFMATILAGPVLFFWLMAWQNWPDPRTQFMEICLRGRLDNNTLRHCGAAYERRLAIVANGYRPTEDGL